MLFFNSLVSLRPVSATTTPPFLAPLGQAVDVPKIIGGTASANYWIGFGIFVSDPVSLDLAACGGALIFDYNGPNHLFCQGGCQSDETCYRAAGANYPSCQAVWFLTAAHCADKGIQTVGGKTYPFYSWNTARSDVQTSGEISGSCDEVWIHQYFNPSTLENDIALCRVNIAPPAGGPNPAFLFTPSASFTPYVAAGQSFIASGWGTVSTQNPQVSPQQEQVVLNIVSNAACQSDVSSQGVTVFPSELCAGGTANPGKDTCQGDSGGPLFRYFTANTVSGVQNVPYVAGATSSGIGCAEGYPGFYTRVSSFYTWVTQTQICARAYKISGTCGTGCVIVNRAVDGHTVCQAAATAPTPGPTPHPTTPHPTTKSPTPHPVAGKAPTLAPTRIIL